MVKRGQKYGKCGQNATFSVFGKSGLFLFDDRTDSSVSDWSEGGQVEIPKRIRTGDGNGNRNGLCVAIGFEAGRPHPFDDAERMRHPSGWFCLGLVLG
jgi:hypothetical protein